MSFHTSFQLEIFFLFKSDCEQVFADLKDSSSLRDYFKCSTVCMISVLPMISNASSFFSSPWQLFKNTLSIIGISITFLFLRFFRFLSIFSQSYFFLYGPLEWQKSTSLKIIFLLINTKFGILARIG